MSVRLRLLLLLGSATLTFLHAPDFVEVARHEFQAPMTGDSFAAGDRADGVPEVDLSAERGRVAWDSESVAVLAPKDQSPVTGLHRKGRH